MSVAQTIVPSLHIDYKQSRLKQYYKERRALRTETTINDTRDFRIGTRLHNLPTLRRVGFAAHRRPFDVEHFTADCIIGGELLHRLTQSWFLGRQRAAALRLGDPRTQAPFRGLS